MKFQGSQKQTALVRQHIDQTIRTRTFKAWSDRIETGVLVMSEKGRKVSLEMKVEECYQWKATGQCSKRDSCSFSHRSNRGQKTQSFSLVPKT